ncbi:MAG: hypothetical protein WCJ35_13235 [Planctomycetota bacterium]
MIPELPRQPMPDWLAAATDPLGNLPIRRLLADSVYYPSCSFDGQPIKYLGGNFHSFVYVDYGVERAEMIDQLSNFRGYRVLAYRDVTPHELTPHGWTPIHPTRADGDPNLHRGWIKSPFGVWAILERTND